MGYTITANEGHTVIIYERLTGKGVCVRVMRITREQVRLSFIAPSDMSINFSNYHTSHTPSDQPFSTLVLTAEVERVIEVGRTDYFIRVGPISGGDVKLTFEFPKAIEIHHMTEGDYHPSNLENLPNRRLKPPPRGQQRGGGRGGRKAGHGQPRRDGRPRNPNRR